MRTPVKVVIRSGPKKGQEWDGIVMSKLEVGQCPIITEDPMIPANHKSWKLSEIQDLTVDTLNNCIYMRTATGIKYTLYVKVGVASEA